MLGKKTYKVQISNSSKNSIFQVHDNQLTSLPSALGQLENLQKLDVR